MSSKDSTNRRKNMALKLWRYLTTCDCEISRYDIPPELGMKNAPIHSIVSDLNNKYYMPVTSSKKYGHGNTAFYSVTPENADRYEHDRDAQKQEQFIKVIRRRATEAAAKLLKLVHNPTEQEVEVMRNAVEKYDNGRKNTASAETG